MTTRITEETIYGYNLDEGRYTINRRQAAIVRMIFYMCVVCELSHERIAFHLGRLGITPPEDRWTDVTVYSILTNPVYIGRGVSPDILEDIEAWEQAQT